MASDEQQAHGGDGHNVEARELREVHAWVKGVMGSDRARDAFEPFPRSALAEDDRRTSPFRTSHTAFGAIKVALDHLFTLTYVTGEHRMLATHSVYSLARGAIESAAIAHWITAPPQRLERIERTLRFHAQDVRDGFQALDDLQGVPHTTLDARLDRIREVGTAAGLTVGGAKWPRGVTSTAAVKAVDERLRRDMTPGPLGAWRLFSGMAHARPWATAATLDRVQISEQDGVVKVLDKNRPDHVVWAALVAQRVIDLALGTYEQKASAPPV